ncbi:MAG: penicillin-binding transpeptidase domain-containing protein [Agathobacter sp.]|nr:penicillin-binding transpeptidase domain-containing protein [uncultured Agathobacter sp.]MEE1035075.1 penicillin-binding transpeptidase domain-containing protein [Agathobacter sp.]
MVLNSTGHRKKTWVLFMMLILCMAGLMIRIGYIMIFESSYYEGKAKEIQERERIISGIRGDILDRNGNVIAVNETAYNISVIHNQISDEEKVIEVLSGELGIDEEKVRKRVEKVSSIEKIKNNVSKEMGEKILSYNLDGVKVDESSIRYYPNNELFSKVIGFAGSDGQGVVGLETVYDKLLAGTPGKILTTCDGRGVEVEGFEEKRIAPGKGKNLITTLDVNIQKVCMEKAKEAYEANRADGVSIIAMNPKNGEIYAMVDYPEYDLNDPFEGEDLNSMWRNSCVSDTYEPGSTFKIITASIALEENLVTLDEKFYCPGYIVVEDRRIRCHKTAGHGSESFVEGIQNSCNPVFIDLGLRIGSDRYYDYFKKFGLLDKTGIDLPGEAGTIMHEKDKIGQVELATIAFGQSFQITPVQLMTTVSSLINGGTRIVPHIGMAESENNGKTVKFEYENKEGICSENTSETMRMLLESVVSEGSGKNAAVEGYKIGGKTATSQTFPRSDNIYIASFLGFYPADDPQIMYLVKINNPKDAYYGGTIAAPVAAELFKETIPYISTLRNDDE